MILDTIHLSPDSNSYDIFVAKLNSSVLADIAENESAIPFVNVFPNPFSNQLNIDLNVSNPAEIILYDLTGRYLLQEDITVSTTLDVEQLAVGIYIYEVKIAGAISAKGKIIRQ